MVVVPFTVGAPIELGLDPATTQAHLGERILLHGGVNHPHVLPFSSPAVVRAHVHRLQRTPGHEGGYIFTSCHNIQAGIPVENIQARVDEARMLSH